jgi:hypothetical protein
MIISSHAWEGLGYFRKLAYQYLLSIVHSLVLLGLYL